MERFVVFSKFWCCDVMIECFDVNVCLKDVGLIVSVCSGVEE